MTLGKQIIDSRKNHGYSQEELAHVSGISLRTIQRIEKGEVNPRGHTLKALAECLGIDLNVLKNADSTRNNQISTEVRTLNILGFLVILLPILSAIIQIIYWSKNKNLLSGHTISGKILSFQILWVLVVLIFFTSIHILTYSITGQITYGHFPVRTTGYIILLIANASIVLHTAFNLNRNRKVPVLISNVPSLI